GAGGARPCPGGAFDGAAASAVAGVDRRDGAFLENIDSRGRSGGDRVAGGDVAAEFDFVAGGFAHALAGGGFGGDGVAGGVAGRGGAASASADGDAAGRGVFGRNRGGEKGGHRPCVRHVQSGAPRDVGRAESGRLARGRGGDHCRLAGRF